jgi:hypothetical protein
MVQVDHPVLQEQVELLEHPVQVDQVEHPE